MGKRVYLSYLLDEDSVVWPGEPTVRIEQDTCIEKTGTTPSRRPCPITTGPIWTAPTTSIPTAPG